MKISLNIEPELEGFAKYVYVALYGEQQQLRIFLAAGGDVDLILTMDNTKRLLDYIRRRLDNVTEQGVEPLALSQGKMSATVELEAAENGVLLNCNLDEGDDDRSGVTTIIPAPVAALIAQAIESCIQVAELKSQLESPNSTEEH